MPYYPPGGGGGAHASSHQNGGGDEVDATGLTGVGGGNDELLALAIYDDAVEGFWATLTAPTSIADFDATNAVVTFTAPASGNVLVRVTTPFSATNGGADCYIALREGASRIAAQYLTSINPGGVTPLDVAFYLSGVTAGSHTYKLAGMASAGDLQLYGGGGASGGGVLIMEVWAAP